MNSRITGSARDATGGTRIGRRTVPYAVSSRRGPGEYEKLSVLILLVESAYADPILATRIIESNIGRTRRDFMTRDHDCS